MDKKIPVFLIIGFLDAGKTTFIKDTLLQDYFMDGSKTLILACEDGEEEYDSAFLTRAKSTLVHIDDENSFNVSTLTDAVNIHQPDRIFLEFNGMWQIPLLSTVLEKTNSFVINSTRGKKINATLEIAQVIMLADGTTFEVYLTNMRALVTEMFKVSEIVYLNRCKRDMPRMSYKRLLRALNPVAQLICEPAEGEELTEEEELPYDLNAPILEIEDPDYAIFHMDIMEKVDRYSGKKVHFRAQFCKPRWGSGKGTFIPGRFAMVCCANDVQFIGYLASADPYQIKDFKNRDWIDVVAEIGYEKRKEYEGIGPVLKCESVTPSTKPDQDVVYL